MDSPSLPDGCKEHQPFNQPPPLVAYNLYLIDTTLVAAIEREGAAWADGQLRELGEFLGTENVQRWGFEANENEPVLHTHDRFGNRRDEVVFHPSWHHLMRTSVEHRIHSLPWVEPRPGAHVARAALLMLTAQNELGHTCPISMLSRRWPRCALIRNCPLNWSLEYLPLFTILDSDRRRRSAASWWGWG